MFRCESLGYFQFNEYCAIHHKVNPESLWHHQTLVLQSKRYLALALMSSKPQFMGETRFIGRFKEPRPKLFLNFNGRTDDDSSQIGMRTVESHFANGFKDFMAFYHFRAFFLHFRVFRVLLFLGEIPLGQADEFKREIIQFRLPLFELALKKIEGHECRDGREESDGGGHQGFGNARRHRG